LFQVAQTFQELKIVVEHASTREMINYVKSSPANIAATLTLHHAMLVHSDVCKTTNDTVRNPFNYCKPIAKNIRDRKAVLEAMVSGNPRFFFGSDSAPHLRAAKIKYPPAAGIDCSLIAKPLIVQIFEENNALGMLNNFTNSFGADYYGIPRSTECIELVKEDWIVPQEHCGIVPFMAGQTLHWKIAE